MKLTESRLRSIVREEISHLSELGSLGTNKDEFANSFEATDIADQLHLNGYDATATVFGVEVSNADAENIRSIVNVPASRVKQDGNDVSISV